MNEFPPIDDLISFATVDNGYKMKVAQERWTTQISHLKDVGLIDKGQFLTEYDLGQDYYDRFGKYVNDHGYAYWSWKPYVIIERLKHLEYGQTLCYFDGGCVFPSENDKLEQAIGDIQSIIRKCQDGNYDLALPTLGHVPIALFARSEIVDKHGLTGNRAFLYDELHWMTGLMLMTKTPRIEKLMNDWYQFYIDNYDTCIRFPFYQRRGQIPGFHMNNADQAVLQGLMFNGEYKIYDGSRILMRYATRMRK